MIFRYRAHLEAELLRQEQLLKAIIAEKERTIVWLKEQLIRERAKSDRLEMFIPGLRPPKAPQPQKEPKPTTAEPAGETHWLSYLNSYMETEEAAMKKAKEQANGVPIKVGANVHEQASGSASGQNGSNETAPSGPGKTSA